MSEDGIGTEPEKTRAVAEWPRPRCQKDVRAFIGLASYYRRFVKDFAKIASPLHGLLDKGRKFVWSDEAEDSFLKLKSALISSPILAMPADYG